MTVAEAERVWLMVSTALQTLKNSGIKSDNFPNELRIKEINFDACRETLLQYFQTYRNEEK